MNTNELRKILDEHKIYVESFGENGSKADLSCADLSGANLGSVNLTGANLSGADLSGAYLRNANLTCANLSCADLSCADLRYANLRNANLTFANLSGADLPDHTYVIMGEEYPITITNGEYLRAGCQNHSIEDWRKFTKHEIAVMDGKAALKFYPRLLDIVDFYLGKGERPEWLSKE
ncbi:pentapeptide repeat family protein [Providencia phage PSTCR6]|nr:pentapeptide repeat family protein [Providencia phage PSTCR6]